MDSRFHGNDRWVGMVEGGDDQNLSFPRKRESRDFCDGKGGHWPGGPWVPGPRWGSGTSSGGMMEAQWIPAFAGMTGGRGWR